MKTFFQDNGIEVSYEARMPMEHEQGKFNQVLEEIKTNARSKYSNIYFKLSNAIKSRHEVILWNVQIVSKQSERERGRQRRFIIVTALMDGTYYHGAFAVTKIDIWIVNFSFLCGRLWCAGHNWFTIFPIDNDTVWNSLTDNFFKKKSQFRESIAPDNLPLEVIDRGCPI